MAAFETNLPDVHSCKLPQPYIPNGKFYKDAKVSYQEEGAEEVCLKRNILFTDREEDGVNYYAVETDSFATANFGAAYRAFVVDLIAGDQFIVHKPLIRVCIKKQSIREITQNVERCGLEDPVAEIATMMHVNSNDFIGHPGRQNVQGFDEAVQDTDYLYIICPYYPGGDLLNALLAHRKRCRKGFPEAHCLRMVTHMIKGLDYLNNKCGIAHRDVKLENTCITSHDALDEQGLFVLIDFGMAVHVPDPSTGRLLSHVHHCGAYGTIRYMAPEAYNPRCQRFSLEKADVWSVGVSFLILLSAGVPPWQTPWRRDEMFNAFVGENGIANYIGTLRTLYDGRVSPDAFDLLSGMLEFDPSKRLSIQEILQKPAILRVTNDDIISARGDGPTGEITVAQH